MNKLNNKKIVMIIAPKMFRDEEFQIPMEILKSEGASITVASSSLEIATGKLGLKVKPELLLNKVKASDFDAVIFVGGSGVIEFWQHVTAHKIANDFYESDKYLTAICSAPVILAKAGLLKDKRATSFYGDESEMKKAGCIYTGQNVEQDGKIITGNGPAAAKEFAEKIVHELSGV